MSKRTLDDFFQAVTDDGAKADVLKAQIAADAEVEKARVTSESFNSQRIARTVGAYVVIVAVALVSSCTATCTADKWHDVQVARLKAEHPEAYVAIERAAFERTQVDVNRNNASWFAEHPATCHIVVTTATGQREHPMPGIDDAGH